MLCFLFSSQDCSFDCVPYFLFLINFLQFSVLPKCLSRTFPPKILLSMPAWGPPTAYFLTSFYAFLPCISFPSCISLSHTSFPSCIFLCHTSLSYFPYVGPALSLPKSSWACALEVHPPAYFLLFPFRTSLYYASFTLTFFYCDCNAFICNSKLTNFLFVSVICCISYDCLHSWCSLDWFF